MCTYSYLRQLRFAHARIVAGTSFIGKSIVFITCDCLRCSAVQHVGHCLRCTRQRHGSTQNSQPDPTEYFRAIYSMVYIEQCMNFWCCSRSVWQCQFVAGCAFVGDGSRSFYVIRGAAWPVLLYRGSYKRVKGRSHTVEKRKPFTHKNPMQPASHRDSHTHPDSAQTQHTTSIAT